MLYGSNEANKEMDGVLEWQGDGTEDGSEAVTEAAGERSNVVAMESQGHLEGELTKSA